jgi:beta-glucanase (GH16 family)
MAALPSGARWYHSGILAPLVAALLANAAWAFEAPQCPALQPESNLTTTFSSKFAETGKIDPTQWRALVGQHGTVAAELQAFVADQVAVKQGVGLRLLTDRREQWDHHYVAGEVTTQGLFSQTYGRFEIIAKMPQANGLWPALWLLPANNTWPPEIDIVEYIYAPWGKLPARDRNSASNPQTTLHWVDESGAKKEMGQGYHSPTTLFQTYDDWGATPPPDGLGANFVGYHSYAIDWRPGSLVWFIDGAPVFCALDDAASGKRVPDVPMFLIMNNAITPGTPDKPGWPGTLSPDQKFPVEMDIASVRVAAFKDVPAAAPLPLEIKDVSVSTNHARPGDTIVVKGTVRVGDSDLGTPTAAKLELRPFDMTQYTGIAYRPSAGMSFPLPRLTAKGQLPINLSYTMPKDLAPGLYSVGLMVGYGGGPVNGAGSWRGTQITQIGVIEFSAGSK